MTDKWIELIIYCEYENWEELENFLYSNDLYTFEIIDPRIENNNEGRWDYIEEDIFKDQFDGVTIKLYGDLDKLDFYKNIQNTIEEKNLGKTNINIIDDQDWKNNWKDFYEVSEIGNSIVIKPTWEDYDNKEKIIIELDPGMAFGTGGHETTKMCLEFIEKYLKKGDKVLDIGCGSGILSIAAKKLGADSVIGTDFDKKAVEISNENKNLNNVDVEFRYSDLFSNLEESGDLIISNIVAEVLVKLLDDIHNHINKNGIMILSGIISEKSNIIEEKLEEENFQILEKKEDDEWVAIVARCNNA